MYPRHARPARGSVAYERAMALPALVPCLGPFGGVYYPKWFRANACRIQGTNIAAERRARDIVVSARRTRVALGADGGVHVARDLRGRTGAIEDADLVDQAAEELPGGATAADP
jgi:hypothetical protein